LEIKQKYYRFYAKYSINSLTFVSEMLFEIIFSYNINESKYCFIT